MGGYRTVDELMQILNDEMLMFDAFMSIIGGNNTYGHQVMFIPKKYITYKKEGAEIRYPELNEPLFYPDDVPFDIRSGVFYFLKDGDSISVSVSLPDKSDSKMSEEEKERLVEQCCISDFLQNKGINTRGKLLKILKDGYRLYKKNIGIEDEYELHRDSMLAAEDDVRKMKDEIKFKGNE